jgi:hypothetical protein
MKEIFTSWPVTIAIAVTIVGVAALFVLRPALLRLFDRMKRVGKDGAVFEQDSVQTSAVLTYEDIMSGPTSASVLDREKLIHDKYRKIKATSDEERVKAVIRAFAMNRLEMEFNDIGHLIFGSQLRLLVGLTSAVRSTPVSDAKKIYNEAVPQFPEIYKGRSFDIWLSYLKDSGLVRVNNDQIDITQYGSDFLKHLVDKRRTYDRKG